MHGGAKLTEAVLRQKFWICQSQRIIKTILKSCVECFKVNPRPMAQYMADLPTDRVAAVGKPFTNTAVDYTGAIHVKMSSVRGCKTHKAYIAIFVCMSTKAIHIEAVTDMTAEAFIAAVRRFVSRRGTVQKMYSDNGTNFVKSNTVLQKNQEDIDEDEFNKSIDNEMAKNRIEWCFSPAGSPHFNGLAEAAVKSVKLDLKKTIGETTLTFEELCTLLAQIEACVNSRPLCAMSSDPNDINVLTPAHFLMGGPVECPPEESHLETKINWLNKWQRVQQMVQYFWGRWRMDYLNRLQVRSKWLERQEGPEINDLVLIKDENEPPAN